MKTALLLSVLATKTLAGLADTFGHHDPDFANHPLSGSIKDGLGATFESVEEVNRKVRPLVQNLVGTDYFRYYKVDLSGEGCPFVDDQGMCGNRACAVDLIEDDSELPEFWRTQYLSKLAEDSYSEDMNLDEDISDSCLNDASVVSKLGCLNGGCDERVDYCYPEDESRNSKGVYVSLIDNPERYTGYAGAHANKVWRAAYLENCFGYYGDSVENPEEPTTDKKPTSFSPNDQVFHFGGSDLLGNAAAHLPKAVSQLGQVIGDTNRYEIQEVGGKIGQDAMNTGEQCAEQRLFYRLISGMHSSVSTHLCQENLNKTTGEWGPNLDCFMARVGNHPERLQNLYFNYALVQRAISKLKDYIGFLYFCREDPDSDLSTRSQLLRLTETASGKDATKLFDESLAFKSPQALALKDEFRRRVRNVNQMMACVGCDRCRLWGKLQTAGYGTALKVLFELPDKPSDNTTATNQVLSRFKRTELVALVNVFDRLSKSVAAVENFREQVLLESGNEDSGKTAVNSEFELAWEGLKYIFRSYIEFPQNCYKIFIYYADQYWNRFIGRDNSEPFHTDL